MNRILFALVVGVATGLTGVGAAAAAPPAQTLGPDVVGWWSTANRNPAVPAVRPPDVGAKDLYVAGANALPAQLATAGAGPVAIAALRFRLPSGAAADTLRLRLAGTHPPAVTMTACRALRPFTTAYGGLWDDAPTYDCKGSGTARLDGDGQVVIDGVDRLRTGRDLAVVLVPGPLDRVVVAPPDSRTLTVSGSTSGSGGLAPAALPPPQTSSTAAGSSPGGTLDAGSLPGSLSGSLPAGGQPPAAAAPVVAPPGSSHSAAAPAAAHLPARPWPTLLGTLLVALLAFVALVRPWGRGPVAAPAGPRGVGRFRSERSGTVPGLV